MNTKFKQTEIGEIPEEWDIKKINNVTEKIIDNRGKTPPLVSKGFELLEVNAILENKKTPDYSVVRKYVDENTCKTWFRGHIKRKDILIPTVGTIGNVAILEETRGEIAQNLIGLRVKKNVNPDYIYYYLKNPYHKERLLNLDIGGVQPSIKVPHFLNLDIALPSLNEQQQISSILSFLDNKIELNRRMNKTLEDMAKALFKHWFVDFEFPNEEGKPYKSSGGEVVESGLGMIPRDWYFDKLMNIADITIGRTPPRMQSEWFSENTNDIAWISIRDMGDSGTYISQTSEYLTKDAVKRFNIPVIPENTVILSFKLTMGRVAITTTTMLSNEAIAHIKLTNESLLPEYIYLFFKKFDFSSLGTTSSIATAVNSQSLKHIPILIPDTKTMSLFATIILPIFKQIKENIKQTDILVRVRDSLLPKLMSGRIRII